MFSASLKDDTVAWYKNGGGGNNWTKHTISTSCNGARSVVGVDVDNDGDMDAMAACKNGGSIKWYENADGFGTTWTAHTISTSADGAFAVFAIDLDEDDNMDCLSASLNNDEVAWYRQLGSPTNAPSFLPTPSPSVTPQG